jgi:hypothetical protein
MTQIILLSGKQGSGKTTLQQDLIRVLHARPGVRCHVVNFADPLYEMHNFCIGKLATLGIKRDIVKDGPLLQLLGTEWGRKTVDENIWVKTLKGQVDRITKMMGFDRNIFLVGDCRFKNEFYGFPEALRVRLECDRETRKARCSMWRENDTHPSEVDLDDCVDEFDLVFDTSKDTTSHMSHMIAAQIDKNIWHEKRK